MLRPLVHLALLGAFACNEEQGQLGDPDDTEVAEASPAAADDGQDDTDREGSKASDTDTDAPGATDTGRGPVGATDTDAPRLTDTEPAPGPTDTELAVGTTDTDAVGPGDTDPSADTELAADTEPPPLVATDTDVGWPTTPGDACLARVHPTAVVVDHDITTSDDDLAGWVCRNRTLSSAGDRAVIWVETGGSAVLAGGHAVVYVEDRADVVVLAGQHELRMHSGARILKLGGQTADTVCPALEIDVSRAPAGGC